MAATNANVELGSKYTAKIYMKSVINTLISEILKNRFYGLTGLESDSLLVFTLSKTAQAYHSKPIMLSRYIPVPKIFSIISHASTGKQNPFEETN